MALDITLKDPYVLVVGAVSVNDYVTNNANSSFGTVAQIFTDCTKVAVDDSILFKGVLETFNDGNDVYYLVDQANIFFVEESL